MPLTMTIAAIATNEGMNRMYMLAPQIEESLTISGSNSMFRRTHFAPSPAVASSFMCASCENAGKAYLKPLRSNCDAYGPSRLHCLSHYVCGTHGEPSRYSL
jgi:hypothetical protein